MSFNRALISVAAGLALQAMQAGALASDPFFWEHRPAFARDYPPHTLMADGIAGLGQRLFFDTRLSRSGTTACASCHRPEYAFAEPARVSVSDGGSRGRRNAPSLINVGFLATLMWDGRFHTLEQQALGPFRRGEMGISVEEAEYRLKADPEYVHLFRHAFGRGPTAAGMASALAAYQRTLVSSESRFERFLRANDPRLLSSLERDGYLVFDRRAGCSNCHRLSAARFEGWEAAPLLL